MLLIENEHLTAYTIKDGLPSNHISPRIDDGNGNLWAVTALGAVKPQGVTAIHQDRQGRVWFGHWGGAYFYENGKFTDFTDRFASTPSMADIHEDRDGTLWFASNAGLFRYRNGAMTRFTTNEGLAGNDVKVICEAHDGTLWIGTYGGLSRLRHGVFTSFTNSSGLASNLVRSLYEDKDGVLWIGSYDGGLTRLKDGRFTRYTTNDGLFNDGVFQILEDASGNLWMSCNRGIYRVAKQQLNAFAEGKISRINSTAYGKADGLLETECNGGQQPAGMRARDGKLWFPTQRGVAVIDPGAIKTKSQAPPVLIESFAANGVTGATLGAVIELSPNTELWKSRIPV